jgi:V/A-type H+-transporting ATPase subunit F
MHKIGVIGDKDSILGFKAAGFDVFEAPGAAEAEKALHGAAVNGYAVIYITEQAAAAIPGAIERYSESVFPAIIPIPGNAGPAGLGAANVRKAVERAIGMDIF